MRSHGSGQACRKSRTTPACIECSTYARVVLKREQHTPGTYRHDASHAIGVRAAKQNDVNRRWQRRTATEADQAQLDQLLEALCG